MKPKQKQTALLLAVLATEIILFNNFFKYALMDVVCPGATDCITTKLLLIKMIIIILLVLIVGWLLNKLRKIHKEPLYIVYLIKGFHVKGSDLIGVLNVLFVLCSAAWIGSEIYMQNMDGYLNALIYTGFLLLYPLIVANYLLPQPVDKVNYHPKVLIIPVSLLTEEKLGHNIVEMNKLFPGKWTDQIFRNADGTLKIAENTNNVPWGPWEKLDPVRKSIIFHEAQFQEIVLLVSKEVYTVINSFTNRDLHPHVLIKNFLDQYYPGHKTNISVALTEFSGNDLKTIKTGIENLIRTLQDKKIENKDLLFNITSGTAVISSAMIMCAIPGDRRAEYVRQDTGLVEEISLDIYDVKDLWYELLEKVG